MAYIKRMLFIFTAAMLVWNTLSENNTGGVNVNVWTAQTRIVVAQDGSGDYKTVTEALSSLPDNNKTPFTIFVKGGTYVEQVVIPKKKYNIVLVGEGPTVTRITGSKNYGRQKIKTFDTATVTINGNDFMAKNIAFENTAGPEGEQAVALRVSANNAIFYNVHIDGYQDTLYAHMGVQFYRECTISGTIDFIFGDALVVFQKCNFIFRKPRVDQNTCVLTAQGRNVSDSQGAFIIQESNISADPTFLASHPPIAAFLGRPWRPYSRTIIMKSYMSKFISPEGWCKWQGTDLGIDTCYYGEYKNYGPGRDTSKRVTWKCIQNITPEIAQDWMANKVYGDDRWIGNSGVPYDPIIP